MHIVVFNFWANPKCMVPNGNEYQILSIFIYSITFDEDKYVPYVYAVCQSVALPVFNLT